MQTSFKNQYPLLEICAYSIADCLAAQRGGAVRVELCAGRPEGGTTPSYGAIIGARRYLDITLHVMIRPRGGHFIYSPQELQVMIDDIRLARQCGVDGIVIGCLTADGNVDKKACRCLIKEAGKLSVTFHRAFDECRNPERALEDIIALGCQRLLTSGQSPTAQEGIPLLRKLATQTIDVDGHSRIIIMPGSGINPGNIVEIAQQTGAQEFHTSARAKPDGNTDAAVVTHCIRKLASVKRNNK
ncbi:MAG: copper homeostasis protein CutC [Prevotellaceae bacterium]|jgi:copper homeostasis protein|nr:copper homeostasis protein CutC [Prevotellaceae bacterium]